MEFNKGHTYAALTYNKEQIGILFDRLVEQGYSVAIYDQTGSVRGFTQAKLVRDDKADAVGNYDRIAKTLNALQKEYDAIYIAGVNLLPLNWVRMLEHPNNIILWEAFSNDAGVRGLYDFETMELYELDTESADFI